MHTNERVMEEREMIKNILTAGAVAACLFAAGCGGGSGSDGSGSNPTSNTSNPSGTVFTVDGPLQSVQTTLSSSLFTPLETATQGTALQGLLVCTDDVVNHNTLDVLNAVLNAAQNPSAASTLPTQLQPLLIEITNNLGGLINALGGSAGCGTASTGMPTTNPLAGTPLASLGAELLPVLQQIQQQGALSGSSSSGSGSSSGTSASGLTDLATLVAELNTALQNGLAGVPASAYSQPVVGGVLTTLQSTVANLSAVVNAVAANNTPAFQSATQTLIDQLLVNVLTQVVPTSYIETQAGQSGSLTGPIDSAAATFAATVAAALTQGETQLQAAIDNSQLAPVLDPVVNQLLPAILGPITQALASPGGSSSSSSSGSGSSSSSDGSASLTTLLTQLTTALTGILGGSGTSCVFASTPLAALCSLIP
jgi:hypothetical protein